MVIVTPIGPIFNDTIERAGTNFVTHCRKELMQSSTCSERPAALIRSLNIVHDNGGREASVREFGQVDLEFCAPSLQRFCSNEAALQKINVAELARIPYPASATQQDMGSITALCQNAAEAEQGEDEHQRYRPVQQQ